MERDVVTRRLATRQILPNRRESLTRGAAAYEPWNGSRCRTPHEVAAYVCKFIVIDASSGCWLWTGYRDRRSGYGYCYINRKGMLIHRFTYQYCGEPIPGDMTIDHVAARGCISRACCNPDHLEVVTRGENALRGNGACAKNARKTHCKHGHPLSGDNLYPRIGGRGCRECDRRKEQRYRERQNAKTRIA